MGYVTKEGLEKLKKELEQLEHVERQKISQQIAEARDKGDLSENAEYDAAKEAQGLLELKISKLKTVLSNAKIIDTNHLDNSKVSILCSIKIRNCANNMEMKYKIVPDNETDINKGWISANTPIAKGLLGKSVGDIAEINLPGGNKPKFEILEINIEE